MSTRSTRSSRNKKARAAVAAVEKVRDEPPADAVGGLSERTWRLAVIVIFVVAAVLRLYNLNLVPLHHDEGVNGNFLVRLVREGIYRYDPANYHGPTLYYFAALIPWTVKLLLGVSARDNYGLTTFTIRLIPALFGLATIWLVFTLRRRLGSIATLSAGLLLALSPGAVYLSRYFIHETLFVFFTLAAVVAALEFYDRHQPVYLILASISLALLFATKETAMISAGVLLIALITTQVYLRLVRGKRKGKKKATQQEVGFAGLLNDLSGPTGLALWLALAFLVFIAINVLFYSSFFTNYPQGVYDSLKTFNFWTKTGKQAHVHPPLTYLTWLGLQEGPLLFLGSVGAAFAVFKPKNAVALFIALWSFGLIAAYSLVPYKTPWLVLNFIVPLAIVSGYAVQSIYEMDMGQLRLPAAVMAGALAVNTYQTIDLNFFNYDNDDTYYVYVYAHTKRGTLKLLDEIDKVARETHQGGATGITIVSPDYWPLPWYLRNYSRVGYFGRMAQSTEPIIIASEPQRKEVEAMFGDQYREVPSGEGNGTFALRPGVDLVLYVRQSGPSPQ